MMHLKCRTHIAYPLNSAPPQLQLKSFSDGQATEQFYFSKAEVLCYCKKLSRRKCLHTALIGVIPQGTQRDRSPADSPFRNGYGWLLRRVPLCHHSQYAETTEGTPTQQRGDRVTRETRNGSLRTFQHHRLVERPTFVSGISPRSQTRLPADRDRENISRL